MADSSTPPGSRRAAVLAVVVVLCLGCGPRLAAATLSAAVNPDTITLGESTVLSLVFENGEPQNLPAIPAIRNLQVQYVGPSRQISIANGQTTSQLTLSYQITPAQAGDYTIPSITGLVDGRPLATQPVKLKVLRTADNGAGAGGQNRAAFLRLVVPKNEVVVGEVFPVDIQLYVVDAQDLQMQPLAAQGFTLGKSIQLPQSRVQSAGTIYHVVAVRTTAAATKTGSLQLGPAECSLNLRVPAARRRRSADPFDDFFPDFFGNRVELRPTKLLSEVQTIQVIPLPEQNKPASFTGAVGDFSFQVNASPTNVAVGDPVTLKVQISGQGALDNITLPPLTEWREFKSYPPNSRVEASDTLGIAGTKTFEQVVVPQNTEVKEIPSLAFSFFDPAQRIYRTLRQPPIPLIVRPSGATQSLPLAFTNTLAGGSAAPPPPQDIVHLKARLGAVALIQPPLIYRPWFLGLQAAPPLLWLGALGWRRWREHLASNPRLVRRQTVARTVRSGLNELRRLAAANDAPGFFALVFHLLQEQLGERLNLPAAAITEAAVEEQLEPAGVPAETLAAVRELFTACNQARYAPTSSPQKLLTLLPKVETVLSQLRKLEIKARA